MSKHRAFEPLEQELGEAKWENHHYRDPYENVVPMSSTSHEQEMTALMDSELRIGVIIVEANKHIGQQLWPLNWGVIIRYEKNYELNGKWRPVVCRLFDSLMERHFHPKELMVIYEHIPFNTHSAQLEARRKAMQV